MQCSHPHISVEKAKRERYHANIGKFIKESEEFDRQQHHRLLYAGANITFT